MKLIYFLFCFLSVDFVLADGRAICSLTEANKSKIESCQRFVTSKTCEDVPSEMRKNCFVEYSQDDFNFTKSCTVDGTKKFLKDTYDGVIDFFSRGKQRLTDSQGYEKRISAETAKNCSENRAVKDANERFNQIVKNIGMEMAYMKFAAERDRVIWKCYHEEQGKGRALGISFDIPDVGQLTDTMRCMNSKSQTEFGCSVVLPALATGGYGGVKALLKLRSAAKLTRQLGLTGKEFEKYVGKVKDKLTLAELASLKHQEDLVSALGNPEISARIGLSDAELKNLVQGIIDSDAGKLKSYQLKLTKASPDSDELFNVIKGVDNKSTAGRMFQEFMNENGMAGKGLLNRELSNDELRRVFNGAPVTQGYLHELPGIGEAIADVNAGKISPADFKKRIGANLFHNGPQAGFWDLMTEQFVPGALKDKDASFSQFFKNTAFQGETAANGVVKARYPSPITKEAFIHTTFDRLSQATAGGNSKIFFELHNGVLKDTPGIKMGELKSPAGSGLDSIRNLLVGDGKNIKSNAQQTKLQFDALLKAIDNSPKLKTAEKANLSEIVRASRDRSLAFDDYMKKFADFDSKDGGTQRITLKDSNGKYLGTIDKNTPTDEAVRLMDKFYAAEQSYNGNPIKDLMQPRILTQAEKLAYGRPEALPFIFCNAGGTSKGKVSPMSENTANEIHLSPTAPVGTEH